MLNKKLIEIGKPRSFKILEKNDDIIKLQQMKEISGRTANPKKNKISLKDIVFEMREEMRNGFVQINKRLDSHQQSIDELKTDVNNIKVVMADLIETNNLELTKTKLN